MGKYAHIAEYLAEQNIEVVGFDLPGHGKNTGGTRGYFGSFNEIRTYASQFIDEIISKFGYKDLPK